MKYEIPDYVSEGFAQLTEDADLCAVSDMSEGTSIGQATGEDLGVN